MREWPLKERVADSNNEGFVDKRDLDASRWADCCRAIQQSLSDDHSLSTVNRLQRRPGVLNPATTATTAFAQILLASREAFRHFSGA